SLLGIAANLVIALAAVGPLGLVALPLATAGGSALNYLLLRVASRKGHGPAAAPGTAFLAKTALATAALFGVAYGLSAAFLERGKPLSEGIPLVLGIAGATAAAGLVYLVAAKALTIPETSFMGRWISRRRSP